MRPHVPRWLAILMGVTGVIGLAAMGGTWWAVGTPHGARWTVERLGAFMPGKLSIDTLSGPVRGPLLAHGVTYETDHFKLTASRVWVDWRLRRLIEKRLDIRALEADSVRLVMFPGPAKAQRDTLNELADVQLPLDVMIARAHLRDFHFTRASAVTGAGDVADSTGMTVLDDLQFERLALRDTLSIGAARVRSAWFDADVAGGATLKGRHPVRLQVAWTWRGGSGRPLSGRGPVAGDLDSLRVAQVLSGPLVADADVVVLHGLRNPQLSGVLDVHEFRPRDMNPAWPEGHATGRLTLAGPIDDLHSTGIVRATLPQLSGVVLTYHAERTNDRVIVHDALLDGPGDGNRIAFNGTIVTGPQPDLHLTGRWAAVTWPPGDSAIVSPSGTFRIDGPPTAYRLHAGGRVGTGSIPPMPLEVAGTGSSNGIAFSSMRSQALGGAIAGTGAIDWAGGVDWRVALHASNLDPATAWPQYPGRIGFGLRARGASGASGTRGEFALDALTGTVRDYPVRGQAAAAFAPGRLAIHSLDLGWGPDSVVANGAVGGPWTLTASVNAPDLGVPIAGGTGSLHAKVTTSGSGPKPRTAVTLQADTVRWGAGAVEHVAGNADLDLSGAGASKMDLSADGLRSGNRRLVHAGITGTGTLRAHTLEARAQGEKDSLRVALRGGWLRGVWQGLLEAVDLTTQHAGTWALEQPSRAVLAPAGIQVTDVAWRSGTARVTGDLDWRREGAWESQLRLDNVPLAVTEPWFTPGIALEGVMGGTVAVGRTPGGRMTADADLAYGPGALTWPSESGRGRVRLDRGTVTARSDGATIAARAAITSPDAGSVNADLRVGMSGGAQPTFTTMTGTVRARLDSLEFVEAFVPGLRRTTGRLTADLHVAGTLARPVWSGDAQLAGGAADVQRLGIHVQDITLTARGEESRHLVVNLSAQSEGGTLTFAGDARVSPQGKVTANGTVRGDRFELMDTPDGRLVVTPDVEVASIGDSLRVRGTVLVPTGFLHAATTGDQVVKPSRDVILVTPAGEVDRRDPNLVAEVRVTLGDDVRLDIYGLKGRVEGGLLVLDRPGWPSSGTGELRISDGTYRAYGQNLQIERGRILFGGGPLKNPGLDVRATRTAGDGTVAGFEVRGTLEAPKLTVVSDPPMSQQDALGYVLFGRPMQTATTNEQAMVRDAGDALGVAGSSILASRVAQPLGLDEASVQSKGGLNQASLMLGRYLSPRLYVNYGIGILDQVSIVRLRYTLSRMWTIQAESGNETRGQVQYTVER